MPTIACCCSPNNLQILSSSSRALHSSLPAAATHLHSSTTLGGNHHGSCRLPEGACPDAAGDGLEGHDGAPAHPAPVEKANREANLQALRG